jgi:hypothetical protein
MSYYTFGLGRTRLYFTELEDTVQAAVVVHMRQGLDTKFITVYELGTDRIRYQYCETCNKATQWDWEGRPARAHCTECDATVALHNVALQGDGDPIEQLALLFELVTNKGFQPSNLQESLTHKHGWERMTFRDVGAWYCLQLKMKDVRITSTQCHNTAEQRAIFNTKIRHFINRTRGAELQARIMDQSALERSDNVG